MFKIAQIKRKDTIKDHGSIYFPHVKSFSLSQERFREPSEFESCVLHDSSGHSV